MRGGKEDEEGEGGRGGREEEEGVGRRRGGWRRKRGKGGGGEMGRKRREGGGEDNKESGGVAYLGKVALGKLIQRRQTRVSYLRNLHVLKHLQNKRLASYSCIQLCITS